MPQEDLVVLFAALLVLGAVLLLFAPLFYRLVRSRLWALSFVLAVPALLVGAIGIAFVESTFSEPVVLVPVVLLVFGARVMSPTLAFFKVRERFEGASHWPLVKLGLLLGFVLFAVYLASHGFRDPGTASGDPVLFLEKLVMAGGTAFVFLRIYWRFMPAGSYNRFMVWIAAILFSMAIAVVAPFAFPAYGILYALSGLMGWFIGAAVALKSPSATARPL